MAITFNLFSAVLLHVTYFCVQPFTLHICLFTLIISYSVRWQYLEKYPFEAPLVELSSPSLPTPLLRNKEKECVEKAKEHLGEPQVKHIYEVTNSLILPLLLFSLTHSSITFLSYFHSIYLYSSLLWIWEFINLCFSLILFIHLYLIFQFNSIVSHIIHGIVRWYSATSA